MNYPIHRNKLKKWYTILFECGLILSMLVFILAFNLDIKQDKTMHIEEDPIDHFIIEDIPQTPPDDIPPAPPKPQIFQPIPDDSPIEDLPNIADFQWNRDNFLPLPKPGVVNNDEEPVPFLVVERKPAIKGGIKTLYETINYPDQARKAGIKGTVIIEFTVSTEGKAIDPVVLRGIGGGCDEEAVRALQEVRFTPGMQRERLVPVKMSLSVTFRLKR